jgi:hypothetical protein
LTLTTANHIAALDISDLNHVKKLDDPDEVQPTISPHVRSLPVHFLFECYFYNLSISRVTKDQKHIVVTDYFVQTGQIGLINTPAEYKALYSKLLRRIILTIQDRFHKRLMLVPK